MAAKPKDLGQCELGDRAKDRITGFEGIVTSRTQFLNGCLRFGVTPKKLKDSDLIEGKIFDVQDLIVLVKAVHAPFILVPAVPAKLPPGGPGREGKNFPVR